jgi:prevent-host-death family protein
MKTFPIHEAKAKLSNLIERARSGELIIVARGKEPMVRLVPVDPPCGRQFGALKGKVKVTETFFEDLPEDELEAWQQ